jgi:excisionase family DNA binding protein
MMTKKEAADFLGVTIRSIEGYAAKGKLHPAKAKGERGDISVYDEDELKKLKAEREQVVYVERPDMAQQSDALTTTARTAVTRRAELADLFRLFESARQPTIADIAAKTLLKLDEAQKLTGLSREILRAAIKAGKLKAKLIGRAWRIKKTDLDNYIQKL